MEFVTVNMIEINTKEFYCDGPEDGEHPRVYYVIDDDTNTKTCMYCNLNIFTDLAKYEKTTSKV